jgi:hypothetical protein
MDACKTITRSFYVQGHHVTATIPLVAGKAVALDFEWDPMPKKRLSHRFIVEYRKKRDAVLKVVAAEINGSVLMIDHLDSRPLATTVYPGDQETTYRYWDRDGLEEAA